MRKTKILCIILLTMQVGNHVNMIDLRKDIVRPRQVIWTPKERSFVQQTVGKTSVIHQTFFGQIKNSIVCGACGKVKEKYEIFGNLTLALPSNSSCSLEVNIRSYLVLCSLYYSLKKNNDTHLLNKC